VRPPAACTAWPARWAPHRPYSGVEAVALQKGGAPSGTVVLSFIPAHPWLLDVRMAQEQGWQLPAAGGGQGQAVALHGAAVAAGAHGGVHTTHASPQASPSPTCPPSTCCPDEDGTREGRYHRCWISHSPMHFVRCRGMCNKLSTHPNPTQP
jgi:hypothetical protein